MILTAILLAALPAAPAPDPRLACAPVRNLTAAGPPPPQFSAGRMQVASGERVDLSVHRCRGGGGFRVQRFVSGRNSEQREPMQWVPAARCAAMGRWIEAGARLRLPAPMLRPHRTGSIPPGGTWYMLNARIVAGQGALSGMELEILDPAGAAPNALGIWIREGERIFRTCRDQGHGGEGFLPFGGRSRP